MMDYIFERVLILIVISVAPIISYFLKKMVAKVEIEPSKTYRKFGCRLFIVSAVVISTFHFGMMHSIISGLISLLIVIFIKERIIQRFIYPLLSSLIVVISSIKLIHLTSMLSFTCLLFDGIDIKKKDFKEILLKTAILIVSGLVFILLRITF